MELIKITENNGKKAVSAKELRLFLEVETPLTKWVLRMSEYGFVENVDWTKLSIENQLVDYALTIETAKHWSMMQRSEKGMQARNYFIECEKKLIQKQLPTTYLEALKELVAQTEAKELAESKVKELEPKAEVFDKISNAENLLTLNDAAKSIGIGRNILMEHLRNKDVFRANNTPYQQYVSQGYFEVKIKPLTLGKTETNYPQTYVTGKGLIWLAKFKEKYI